MPGQTPTQPNADIHGEFNSAYQDRDLDAAELHVPETRGSDKVTPGIKETIQVLDGIKTTVADYTGETEPELTETVDGYLVEHAEKTSDEGPSAEQQDAVAEALVEGAEEAIGDRPAATVNPILQLEVDGYDEVVVQGIRRLHQEGAVLPDGKYAAEVVARTADLHEQPAGHEGNDSLLDTALQHYLLGATKEYVREHSGIDPREISEYLKGLPQEQREYYKIKRREAIDAMKAKDVLKSSSPELFEGRVRQDFEDKLRDGGYTSYAVGFNQHDGICDYTEAMDYLREAGGVELGIYNPDQRFLLHDKDHPMDDYPLGYFGPKTGRFVYAFPVEATSTDTPRDAVALQHNIPKDTFTTNQEGETVANARYCVGFIDSDQVFHSNEGFMDDEQATNKPNAYAEMSDEQLVKIVGHLKNKIRYETSQGNDAAEFRDRLAQVGTIIKGRR